MIEITVKADESDLDGLVEFVKASFPAAAGLRKARPLPGSGLRVELDAPKVGTVEAVVRLEVEAG